MSIVQAGAAYIAAAVIFLALDAVWLSTMNQPLYRAHLSDILMDGFRLAPAIAFYLIYVAGMVYFAILPGWTAQSVATAAINGALLGFLCYATYDLTNQATLKTWSTVVTLADLAWGAFVTASASAGSAWLLLRFMR